MSFFIPEAQAQVAAAPPGPDPMFTLVMIVVFFLFMYFFTIRPQRKRQKEHQDLVGNLKKGDEVVTASGMVGKIVKVEEDFVVIEAAAKVELKFQRSAVHAVLPKGTLKSI